LIVRRTALAMLAAVPFGAISRHASAALPAEQRQAGVLGSAEFTDAQGALHRLTELTRPLVLINLWAAWCPGCLEELPSIRTLAARLGPEAIDVVLLSHEMNWRGDLAYVRTSDLPFRHWRLSPRVPQAAVSAAFRIDGDRFGLPQSLILAGRDRILVDVNEGSRDWATPDQVRLAQRWLQAVR
jgi:thiol-disulfide isomerase/thioredoxin